MFYSKYTGGFYTTEIHGANIPADAVAITESQHSALMDAQSQGSSIKSDANGAPIAVAPPAPTLAQITANFEAAIQAYLDSEAQAKGYDNITTASSYASAPNPFQAEGASFVTWRGNVWAYCYGELAKVQAGTRPMPTIAEIIAELPVRA